jgi:chromosomal replication initiator protein
VIYARAETFTDHVVMAIRAGEMSTFRQAYRNVDALIIDDAHIFSRKGATQEELFHTFNTLHLSKKLIILSANCPPSELQHIEPRLVSRFEWGIALALEPTSKEDILRILNHKAKLFNFNLRPAIAQFLVDTFNGTDSVIRALEALILRMHLNKKSPHFSVTTLNESTVRHLLKDLILEEEYNALTPAKIIKTVAEQYGITTEDILSKSQSRECTVPRQVSMHLCRHELNIPFIKIGDIFGRDHSTVMSSIKRVQKALDSDDANLCPSYRAIRNTLNKA